MQLFEGIEKLITEHGSAAVLSQQLAFAKDRFEDMERKVSDLQVQVGRLEAQLERERGDNQSAQKELAQLRKQLEEEVIINHGVEFRRGKRTAGRWTAFCPRCHLPVGHYPRSQHQQPFCTDESKCGWSGPEDCPGLNVWIAELPK